MRPCLLAVALATVMLVGCAKHPPPASPLHAMSVVVAMLPGAANERLARSTTMTKPLRGVIRNATAWSVFWTRAVQDSAAPPMELPQVDFSREMLLVACDGRRPNGYRIEIPGAALRNDTLFVLVRGREEAAPTPAAARSPVAVVRVQRTDGPVVFRLDQPARVVRPAS